MNFGYLLMTILTALILTSSPSGAVEVTRFGAVPDDGKDDTAAFLAAFREAAQKGDKHIVIPKGRYDLQANGNPANSHVLFPISNQDDLIIEGRGSELIMSGAATIFGFSECRNVTVRNLSIDWARPPFSEGVVTASVARSFDVEIPDAYPVKGGEAIGAFMSYDPVTRLPNGKDLDVYGAVERTELIRPQVLRIHLNRDIPVPVGTLLVLRHEVYGNQPFEFHRCSNVHVNDVNVYCAPGMGLIGIQSENITLKRFHVMMRPGSGRLMSATADATHFGGCKGTVSLEDCKFQGMGDDGVNVKSGLYLIIRKRVDDHSVQGQHNLKMVDMPDPGNVMEFSHVDTLLPYASLKVKSVRLEPGEEHIHDVKFEDTLPAEMREGDVMGNASRTPKFRMRKCTVEGNRARGVLCQTRDAIIEDCTFKNCTGAGVLVLTEVVYFFESIGTRNVTVRNNVFDNCNHGAASADAPLCALAWLANSALPPKPGVHKDVSLIGNRIIGTEGTEIFAAGVDGLKIEGNILRDPKDIRTVNCDRMVIEGNKTAQ